MHDDILQVRPTECAILEPLGEQTHSRAVPEDQLHAIRTLGAEHINGAGERIGPHLLAHQSRQAFGALAEVDRPRCHHHPDCTSWPDHPLAFSACSTAATVFASAPRPIRTVTQSISTSIIPERSACRRLRTAWRGALAGGGVSTTAGTNSGAAVLQHGASGCRACRRQPNNCCGDSPWRRATSETTAPGASVSSTRRALSSAEKRRRRPVPVITSTRRTVVPSGLSVWSSIDTRRSPF